MWPWKRIQHQRQIFLSQRKSLILTNEDFTNEVMDIATASQKSIMRLVRMLIAEECSVPLEKIIPSELCVVLDSLMGCEGIFRYYFQPIAGWDGFDADVFFYKLEYKLRLEFKCSSPFLTNQRALPSLWQFGRNIDYSINYSQTFKEWLLVLMCELEQIFTSHPTSEKRGVERPN